MSLIQEYLALATDIVSTEDFSKAVYFKDFSKEHNRKVTRMREIATEIEKNYPNLKDEFCELLIKFHYLVQVPVDYSQKIHYTFLVG